jgi:hypothetical protein
MTSSLQVKYIPIHGIHSVWGAVEPFIAASNQYAHGELSVEEVKVRICDGTWLLVVATDDDEQIHGAAVVNFYNRTDNRVAYVSCIGGKFLANRDTFSQFCDLLRAYGATCIEGSVRKSLMRLWARLGAREKSINIQFAL